MLPAFVCDHVLVVSTHFYTQSPLRINNLQRVRQGHPLPRPRVLFEKQLSQTGCLHIPKIQACKSQPQRDSMWMCGQRKVIRLTGVNRWNPWDSAIVKKVKCEHALYTFARQSSCPHATKTLFPTRSSRSMRNKMIVGYRNQTGAE